MKKVKQNYFRLITLVGMLFVSQAIYALEPLDTQIGQDGMSVHLVKAKVSNGVLTASILYDNDSGSSVNIERPDLNEVHYIAGTKKYPVLKDANEDWLASPVHNEDKLFEDNHNGKYHLAKKKKIIAWFKFPAPPEGTSAIEVSVPGVSPFSVDLE